VPRTLAPRAARRPSDPADVLVTRIAPTPSGYLHAGNAVNLVLTSWLARARTGRLLLRIDDFDTVRARPEYLADVFDTLAWLGITADAGPAGPADFHLRWSMATRLEQFRAARDRLRAAHPGRVFVCRCSRRDLDPTGRCVAGCREHDLRLEPGRAVLRLAVPPGLTVGGGTAQLAVPAGDHVLWRRDDLPAYQLGSVVADEDLGVTAIVRGMDLVASSALQLHIAALLPAPGFARAELLHHDLITSPKGEKLSKSAGAQAHPLPRTPDLLARIRTWAEQLGAPIGIGPA
jgi:glutamyl/glutaminyl-tRNA synthetase